jgi:hypothetical protein
VFFRGDGRETREFTGLFWQQRQAAPKQKAKSGQDDLL